MPLPNFISSATHHLAARRWRCIFFAAFAALLMTTPLAFSDGFRSALAKRFHIARMLLWPDLSAEAVAGQVESAVRIKTDHFITRVSFREQVATFYSERGFAPLWIDKGEFSNLAVAVREHMARAEEIGLDPDAYALPPLRASSATALAELELRLTNAVLTYVSDAQSGRLDYQRIAPGILFPRHGPEPSVALAALADSADIEATMESFEPPHPEYRALKQKLAQLRETSTADPVRIDAGLPLSLAEGERVTQVRRLNVADEDGPSGQAVVDAVREFQRERNLPATGLLDLATLDALNGPTEADILRANMERWRWVPRDLGKDRVVVNIPDFTMRVFEDGVLEMAAKVVVGAASHPTPVMSDSIESLTVNPIWNVPASIVEEEYLPLLETDPRFFSRNRFRIATHDDGSIRLLQEPGEGNALGHVRFNLPNKFLVYQHDTPDRYLFDEERRAYSHGCIRVENPLQYSKILLRMGGTSSAFTTRPLHAFFGPEEVDIPLYRPVPIHLTYQTAFVNDAGELELRDDLYGYDARIVGDLQNDELRSDELKLTWQNPEQSSLFGLKMSKVEEHARQLVRALSSVLASTS